MYYVAKKELFAYSRILSWLLSALGAFPVDRGAGDAGDRSRPPRRSSPAATSC